ncbi:MAG: methyltransferase [Aliishimia sp.]
MSQWPQDDLSRDAFLGGALHLWQPKRGYRAGVDPVLLAASVRAQSGQCILDLGCGAGAAALSLGTRVPGLRLFGVEQHVDYADLARRNGAHLAFEVHTGDVSDMPAALRALSFDHVIANPPYYCRTTGTAAPDPARETALGEATPLSEWISAGTKRLKPKGFLHMILKADRLADALRACKSPLGSIEIIPFAPRVGRAAELIIVRARKEGRAALKLHAPIVLHEGAEHTEDGIDYAQEILDVLRHGKAIST